MHAPTRQHYVFGSSVRPSTPILRDFDETCHTQSSREWELLKRFSISEVKGQGHSEAQCTFLVKRWPSTYSRPSVVRAAEAYRSTVRHQG